MTTVTGKLLIAAGSESSKKVLRVDSTTTEVPDRIAVVEDEETELGEDATDTPRQQICKKRRIWRGCVLYLSVGYSHILGYGIMGHS